MVGLINIVIWGVIVGVVYWFFIRPFVKNIGVNLKMKVRDVNIKQIKRSIKDLDITKGELFDE